MRRTRTSRQAKTRRTATKKTSDRDLLLEIVEERLYDFQEADINRKAFVDQVTRDYFNILRKTGVLVPQNLLDFVTEEVEAQVNTMLLKKIYGFHSISDYQKTQKRKRRVRVRERLMTPPRKVPDPDKAS